MTGTLVLYIPSDDGQRNVISVKVFSLLCIQYDTVSQETLELDFHREFIMRFHFLHFNKRLAVESRCLCRDNFIVCKKVG